MLIPSKATPTGWIPTVKVPRRAPSLARSLVTLLLCVFATQMLAPSKATAVGRLPTLKVPCTAPSLVRNLVTLELSEFVTQMLAPSKARPIGDVPTVNLVVKFGDHLSKATCNGLRSLSGLAELFS